MAFRDPVLSEINKPVRKIGQSTYTLADHVREFVGTSVPDLEQPNSKLNQYLSLLQTRGSLYFSQPGECDSSLP